MSPGSEPPPPVCPSEAAGSQASEKKVKITLKLSSGKNIQHSSKFNQFNSIAMEVPSPAHMRNGKQLGKRVLGETL